MPYLISIEPLVAWVREQAQLVADTPMPDDLADVCRAAPLGPHDLSGDELRAVWLAAGIATQIGLRVVEHPEQWIDLAEHDAAATPRPVGAPA